MKLKLITLSLFAFAVFGCNSTKTSSQNVEDTAHNKIEETYWKLTKLEGKDVKMGAGQDVEPHFMLKTGEKTMFATSGCNTLNSEYKLEKGDRIRFTKLATTLKLCPDMVLNEGDFFKVFELADNYTIVGDTLSLNVGRRAPLAVFQAVYFE
ncbi:MAG: META domain-containing protein [Ferruginibacter sp.]